MVLFTLGQALLLRKGHFSTLSQPFFNPFSTILQHLLNHFSTISRPFLNHFSNLSQPFLNPFSTLSQPLHNQVSTISQPFLNHFSTILLQLNAGLSATRGYNKVHFAHGGTWGWERVVNDTSQAGKDETIVTIESFPLYSVLMAIGNPTVDYFSLDVNSIEFDILKTIPFDKVDIRGKVKGEFVKLHDKLKEFEEDPYQSRAFLYLDIISWLESKIDSKPIGLVIKEKFEANLLRK